MNQIQRYLIDCHVSGFSGSPHQQVQEQLDRAPNGRPRGTEHENLYPYLADSAFLRMPQVSVTAGDVSRYWNEQ